MARPPSRKYSDAFTGMRGIVLHVFVAEARRGRKRGDLTKATLEVAARLKIRGDTLKRAVSRNRHLRLMADFPAWAFKTAPELERRMLGMPDDVRAALLDAEAEWLLQFLRENSIDGTCPRWLIDAVRSGGELMSPK
jgi:hypothetical protein